MSIKLLLDTDIGSDIDDAVCLAHLLARPDCELLGITTVSGAPIERAMLASALCRAAGRPTPILPGAADPLLVPQRQPHAPQAAALGRWPHQHDFPQGQAIEFMRQTIRRSPGEITLLAIGPLTNVALLFATDPEIAQLLKQLVLMCGVFTDQMPGVGPLEWNALLDPHAAAMVYRAPVAVHRSIGLDVTCQVTMPAHAARERFQDGLLRVVRDFAEVWFLQADRITFHDPLAALTIFDEQVCTFMRGDISVELTNPHLQGQTRWQPGGAAQHQVALAVDQERFFAQYFAPFG